MKNPKSVIALVAAGIAAAFVHGLLAPRISASAYGGAGDWLVLAVDLLAFGGTWVTVSGFLASRNVGLILQALLHGNAAPSPRPAGSSQPTASPAKERHGDVWTASEQLAGRLAMKALKGGNAAEYLRAFRLLHADSDAALAEALLPAVAAAPAESAAPKSRSARGGK